MTPGWDVESAHTARALARLVDAGSQCGTDLDVAIAAHAAVLDTVAAVFRDIVPWYRNLRPPQQPPRVDLADRDPIRAFAFTLRCRHPVHLDRSPSQLLERGLHADPITAAWATAGRHAILATRAWPQGTSAALDGPQCWRAIAQVAALAEAVAVLDTDLIAVTRGRPDLAEVLGATAGMRLAAREVLGLADRATPEHPGTPPRDPTGRDGHAPRRLVPERADRYSDLPRAAGRLTALIDRADILSPDQVRGCAQVARNLAVLAAGEAVDHRGHPLRAELGALARTLHVVATEPRTEAALITIRPRALDLCLRDLHRHSFDALGARHLAAAGPDLATRLVRRLPDLVSGLDRRAHAQVDAHLWAVLDRREGEHPLYAIASLREPGHEPPLLGRLRDATAAAAAVRDRIAPPRGDQPQLVPNRDYSARAALVHAVADRLAAVRPPAHPAGPGHGSDGPDPGRPLAR